jgi:uncharacterized protein
MTSTILPAYAALFGLMFVALSLRTLRLRRSLKIAVGDAGNPAMLRAMRVHANFAEYVPLALLLVLLVEGTGGHPALVHGLCLALLAGRLSHAWGVSQPRENYRFRIFGMVMTFTTLVLSALILIGTTLVR